MKYIEVGIGNTWIDRTETELANGSEFEQKGIVKPIVFHSVYIRVRYNTLTLSRDYKNNG
ncbi:hypothetical protein BVG16_32065 [Paenibacillus selenitireducens]|uniref:DUF3977 family protein n=1 Tax=Paenibacillus selenitireducens TaxID=1324314 RepID=A0A1T2WZN0_9BACL|nr:DUF3977 family protein [Paenibacillus selenitireducens]OPA72803.1 hypothetical protein BVG16_32065 [Paenibacillus selenitireducens]